MFGVQCFGVQDETAEMWLNGRRVVAKVSKHKPSLSPAVTAAATSGDSGWVQSTLSAAQAAAKAAQAKLAQEEAEEDELERLQEIEQERIGEHKTRNQWISTPLRLCASCVQAC